MDTKLWQNSSVLFAVRKASNNLLRHCQATLIQRQDIVPNFQNKAIIDALVRPGSEVESIRMDLL